MVLMCCAYRIRLIFVGVYQSLHSAIYSRVILLPAKDYKRRYDPRYEP